MNCRDSDARLAAVAAAGGASADATPDFWHVVQGGTPIVVVADAAAARSVNLRNHTRAPILTFFAGAIIFATSPSPSPGLGQGPQ